MVVFFSSEEWITAIESINRQTTPHLQHQLPMNTCTDMVTNNNADNRENQYPIQNQIFTRRPVRKKEILNFFDFDLC